jgi:hypothetical protein
VLSRYGHLYEKEKIIAWIDKTEKCPQTRAPLKRSDLIEFKELSDLIGKARNARKTIIEEIDLMDEEKSIQKKVDVFKKQQQEIINQLTFLQEAMYAQVHLKELYLLDNQNPIHLQYWSAKVSGFFGGIKVICNNQSFRVPTRVFYLMQALNKVYPTKKELLEKIEKIKSGDIPKSSWADFFPSLRSGVVHEFYDQKEIMLRMKKGS